MPAVKKVASATTKSTKTESEKPKAVAAPAKKETKTPKAKETLAKPAEASAKKRVEIESSEPAIEKSAAKKVKAETVKAEDLKVTAVADKSQGSSKSKKRELPAKEEPKVVDTSVKPTTGHIKIACDALLQHVRAFEEKKKQKLISLPGVSKEEETVFLQIGLKGMPEKALKTFKGHPVKLPHPFRDVANTTVCMFVKDKPEAKKWLGDDYEVHGIKKIISLQQLRTDYKAYQDLRELADLYDAFVADDRIVCMLPKALGKAFYVGSKRPLPIRLAQKDSLAGNVKNKVDKALQSAFFYLSGVSTSLRIGTTAQSAVDLTENIEAALAGAVEHIPGKWKGVQSVFIKSEKSAALPLYEAIKTE